MAAKGTVLAAIIVVIVLIAAAIGVYAVLQSPTGIVSIHIKDDAIA